MVGAGSQVVGSSRRRVVQLDPWWYVGTAAPAGCGLPTNWTADPPIWPDGLRATGLPLTLYSSYFAPVAEGNVMTGFAWADSVYINVGWFEGKISQVGRQTGEARIFNAGGEAYRSPRGAK